MPRPWPGATLPRTRAPSSFAPTGAIRCTESSRTPTWTEQRAGSTNELKVRIEDDGRFAYEEDTVLELAALPGEPLHHTDRKRLAKVG